jgi:hypothetical protein
MSMPRCIRTVKASNEEANIKSLSSMTMSFYITKLCVLQDTSTALH